MFQRALCTVVFGSNTSLAFFVLMENDLWVIPLGELSEGLEMKWHSEMREMASKNAQEFFSSFQQTFTMCLS